MSPTSDLIPDMCGRAMDHLTHSSNLSSVKCQLSEGKLNMHFNGSNGCHDGDSCNLLTHLTLNNMAAILQMIVLDACIFVNGKFGISIQISLKLVPEGPIDNNAAFVLIMGWHRIGDIIWTSADLIHPPIYVVLGGDELIKVISSIKTRLWNSHCLEIWYGGLCGCSQSRLLF